MIEKVISLPLIVGLLDTTEPFLSTTTLERFERLAVPSCLRVILLKLAFLVSEEGLLIETVNAHNSIPLSVTEDVPPIEALAIVLVITE